MNDDKQTDVDVDLDKLTAPSIWVIPLLFGGMICAGFAAYEAFHLRTGLWWGLGAGIFMLLNHLIRKRST